MFLRFKVQSPIFLLIWNFPIYSTLHIILNGIVLKLLERRWLVLFYKLIWSFLVLQLYYTAFLVKVILFTCESCCFTCLERHVGHQEKHGCLQQREIPDLGEFSQVGKSRINKTTATLVNTCCLNKHTTNYYCWLYWGPSILLELELHFTR